VRWAAALGILLLPVVCVGWLYRDLQTNARWAGLLRQEQRRQAFAEIKHMRDEIIPRVRDTMPAAEKVYREQVEPIIAQRPERRDPEKATAAAQAAADQEARLKSLAKWLEDQGPFTDKTVAEAWRDAREYVLAGAALFAQAQRALPGGADWKKEDAALTAQKKRFDQARAGWNAWEP
jgi:hypothetical protein